MKQYKHKKLWWIIKDQENWVLWHWNTFEVWIASGIEEAIWHIEQFEEKLSKVE